MIDTAGVDQFTSMRDIYWREGDGFVMVYCIDSKNSFGEMQEIWRQLTMAREEGTFSAVIVGNKCDLEDKRMVATQEGLNLANSWKTPFFETSAKKNLYVNDAFERVISLVIEKKTASKQNAQPESPRRRTCCIL